MLSSPALLGRILLLALASLTSQASQAGIDLVTAWQAARDHDPAFDASRAAWRAGQTKARQGRALLQPEVVITASGGYIVSDRDTHGAQFSAPGFGTSRDVAFRTKINGGATGGWALSAQQPLYNAQRLASARQLDRQSQLADIRFRAAQQDLILRTARAYFAVLLAEDTLETLRAQREAATRARDVAREKFESGASAVTDRDEAQARFDQIATRELSARDDLQMKRVAFADLTGKPAEGLSRLSPAARLGRFKTSPVDHWLKRASLHNILILSNNIGIEIARDEVDKFSAAISPSLDLIARIADDRMLGDNGLGTTSITSSTRTIGIQLTIPLFTGGMRSAKHEEATALAEKARLDARAIRQEVRRQTRAAWLGVNTGVNVVRAREQALRSARSRLDATETGKEVGARTMLDLMNAQADFFQAQRDLVRAKYQLLMSRLSLWASAGDLSESRLREINASLSPFEPAFSPSE